MIQKDHIKYQREYQGKSLRMIAQETSYDFRTVKKYADLDNWNEPIPRKRRGRPTVLDPVKPIIDQWLVEDLLAPRKQRHTAQRVYDRLRSEYPDLFQASVRTVRSYVAQKKKELYSAQEEGYLPLTHPQGEAQVDFGEAIAYEKGKLITVYFLNLSFPYSNASFTQLFKGQNQECLFTGLSTIFEYIGRVPTCIWFDNCSTIVSKIKKGGNRILTDAFLRFALHYGFTSHFCNPGQGHEKGHVEGKVGYHRRNFLVPVPRFDSLLDYNRTLLPALANDRERFHYRKQEVIDDLFQEELTGMRPLPPHPYMVKGLVKAKTDKMGKLRFESNWYSVSPQWAHTEVWVEYQAFSVTILTRDYQTIITHPRLYGTNQESMIWAPYLETLAKRPQALKYTSFYQELPHPWQEYLNTLDRSEKKRVLKSLALMVSQKGIEGATIGLLETLKGESHDLDSLNVTWRRLTNDTYQNEESTFSRSDLPIFSYHPDLSCYDHLLKGENPS